jgi:hypothetical protein
MQVDILEFIRKAGLSESLYPGKRVVKSFPQPGEFKSHCVVYDWRDASKIRIEVKAGLHGKDLSPAELSRYPVSFQAPTFLEIDVASGHLRRLDSAEILERSEEEDEGDTQRGSASGGGGKRPSLSNFSTAAEGWIPNAGELSALVVMGMEIAKEAYENVLNKLFTQVEHAKIIATDLMAAAGKLITRYTPPAFLKPKGDENKVYKYDRMKNEAMFSGMVPT